MILIEIPRRTGRECHIVADAVTHVEVVDKGLDIWLRGTRNAIESSLSLEEFEDRLEMALGKKPLIIRKPILREED